MNWEAISAIAEVIGLIAIIASLLYLARQINQNTNALQSSTRGAFVTGLQNVNAFALENSDVWHRGAFLGEDLEGEEFTRYLTIIHAVLNAYEALYSEYLAGNVEEDFWQGKVRQMGWVYSVPSSRKAWEEYTFLFDDRFVKYMNEVVKPKSESIYENE